MATKTLSPEMQALVDSAIAALPSGFQYQPSSSAHKVNFVYKIDSNYSCSPVVPLSTLMKLQELFGAKHVQVQGEYEAYARPYENSLGGPEAEIEFAGSCFRVIVIL